MKSDLFTSIGAAIAGILISYFVVNMFFGEIEGVQIKSVDPNLTIELAEPNKNVFNYQALNPTVEVYVGECDEYDENGECIEQRNFESENNLINNSENINNLENNENTENTENSEESNNSENSESIDVDQENF